MKKQLHNTKSLAVGFLIVASLFLFAITPLVSAHMMYGNETTTAANDETGQTGESIYNKLSTGELTCADVTDKQFDALGDLYMSRMMGSADATMDQYMEDQLGPDGSQQAHIAMGKRLSGCDTSAAYPAGASDYTPMAWMGMMGGYYGASWSATNIALLTLLVLSIMLALFGWLRPHTNHRTSPLDTLKSRYAKGEITQSEFKKQKADLGKN